MACESFSRYSADGSRTEFELPVEGSYIPEYEPRSSPVQARYDAHDYVPSGSEDEDEVGGMLIASSRKGKRKQAARKKGSGSCSAKKQKQMGHGTARRASASAVSERAW